MKYLFLIFVLIAANEPSFANHTQIEFKGHEQRLAPVTQPPITVNRPWTRPGIKGRNLAIYMQVVNTGNTDADIIGASSKNCQYVELHDHRDENGVMRMHKIGKIKVPKHGNISFRQGAKHIMCRNLNRDITWGDVIQVDLELKDGRHYTVNVPVKEY